MYSKNLRGTMNLMKQKVQFRELQMPEQFKKYPIYLVAQIVCRISISGDNEALDERSDRILDLTNIVDKININEIQVKNWFLSRDLSLSRGTQ